MCLERSVFVNGRIEIFLPIYGICRYQALYNFITRLRASSLFTDQIGSIDRNIAVRPTIFALLWSFFTFSMQYQEMQSKIKIERNSQFFT